MTLFEIGTKVEVLSFDEGFEWSRSEARVAEELLSAPADMIQSDLPSSRPLFIRHLHLLDDTTGDFLTEHVHVACVRPVQPIPESPPPLESYQFGEEVDVWVSDMWWEGRIVPGRCTSPSGTRLHTVKSTLHGDDTVVRDPRHIRKGMQWSREGGWTPRTCSSAGIRIAASTYTAAPPAAVAPGPLFHSAADGRASGAGPGARSHAREQASDQPFVGGMDRSGGQGDTAFGVPQEASFLLPAGASGDALGYQQSEIGAAPPSRQTGAGAGAGGGWRDFLTQQRAEDQAARPAGHRAVSAPEQRRLASNAAVDAASAAAAHACAAFLSESLSELSPFMAPTDPASLQRAAARSPAAACPSEGLLESLQLLEPPPALLADLRPYQLEGLRWLATMRHQGASCILADEMGLGKTLQTISLFAYLATRPEGLPSGPHLVVCPLSVLPSWMAELAQWCPSLRVVRLHTTDKAEGERLAREMLSDPASFDVAVTTYDMALSDSLEGPLRTRLHWHTLVLDEGHKVKNTETQITQSLRKIKRAWTLLLTGTPLQNNMRELFALMNFLHPTVFTDSAPFERAFDLKSQKHEVDTDALAQAHYLLRPFWLRRTKAEVELSLPSKTELVVKCPLSAEQTLLYRRLLLQDWEAILSAEQRVGSAGAAAALVTERAGEAGAEGPSPALAFDAAAAAAAGGSSGAAPSLGQGVRQVLNNLVMQLRKCCNHPILISDPERWPPLNELVAQSGKLAILDRLLERLKRGGHRVVLFSQFTSMMDVLQEHLRMRGHAFCRLDGGTNRVQRAVNMRAFNDPASETFVFLLSTRAGGLGLNLQSADTCILYDSDWNPQVDAQAMARVHRIGQTRPVSVLRLITDGSVEERIFQRAQKKLLLDSVVTRGSTAAAEGLDGLDGAALLASLRFGADGIFANAEGRRPSDEDLDALCDRTEAGEAKRAGLLLQNGARTAADFKDELADAPLSTLLLQGKDHSEARAEAKRLRAQSQQRVLVDSGARQRIATTVEVDGFTVLKANMHGAGGARAEPAAVPHAAPAGGRAGLPAKAARKKVQVAGKDYDHSDFCQLCWDGGELLCCDFCPVATHAHCFDSAATFAKLSASRAKFQCRHHWCSVCGKKAQAAGGMLFRCECCPNAFCDDHLPPAAAVTTQCQRFMALGQEHPSTACFITCSEDCTRFRGNNFANLFDPANPGAAPLRAEGAGRAQKAATLPVWCKAGDESIQVTFLRGREKPLSQANFSDLKLWAEKAGMAGVQVGKHWRKLKELSGTRLTDAENVLVMRILTDVVRDGLRASVPASGKRVGTVSGPVHKKAKIGSGAGAGVGLKLKQKKAAARLPKKQRRRNGESEEEESEAEEDEDEEEEAWPAPKARGQQPGAACARNRANAGRGDASTAVEAYADAYAVEAAGRGRGQSQQRPAPSQPPPASQSRKGRQQQHHQQQLQHQQHQRHAGGASASGFPPFPSQQPSPSPAPPAAASGAYPGDWKEREVSNLRFLMIDEGWMGQMGVGGEGDMTFWEALVREGQEKNAFKPARAAAEAREIWRRMAPEWGVVAPGWQEAGDPLLLHHHHPAASSPHHDALLDGIVDGLGLVPGVEAGGASEEMDLDAWLGL